MSDLCKQQIHSTVICFAYIYSELTAISELQEHVSQVSLFVIFCFKHFVIEKPSIEQLVSWKMQVELEGSWR